MRTLLEALEKQMALLIIIGKINTIEYKELDKEYDSVKELIMLEEQGLL